MIRRALPRDARTIADLHGALFDEGWLARDIASVIEAPSGATYVASDDSRILGFIIGRVVAGEGEILSLGVSAEARRRGLGGALVTALLDQARRGDAKTLFLEVAADNTAALAFYRRFGFVTIATRRGYYQRPGNISVDAACMALDL